MDMGAAAGVGGGGAGGMVGDSMGGGSMSMMSPSTPSVADAMAAHDHHSAGGGMATPTHMTFFWGKDVQILFSGWPGDRPGVGMYLLALLSVFVASAAVDGLSYLSKRLTTRSSASAPDDRHGQRRVPDALLLTALHALRLALAYMVMLSVMSFNVGVLVAAVAGHAVGFLLSASGLFEQRKDTHSIQLNNSHISVSKF